MPQKHTLGVLALVSLIGVSSAMPALARRGADDNTPRGETVSATVSKERAIEIAQALLKGSVRKAQLERDHNRAVWKIRIISEDKTKRGDFRINALTESVIRQKIKTIRGKGQAQSSLKSRSSVEERHDSNHDDNDDHGRRHGGRGSDDN